MVKNFILFYEITKSLYTKVHKLYYKFYNYYKSCGGKIMAKAIRATPTLSGKCAEKFAERLNQPPTEEKKEFLKRSREVYRIINSNSK